MDKALPKMESSKTQALLGIAARRLANRFEHQLYLSCEFHKLPE